jgi:hypothetical protein
LFEQPLLTLGQLDEIARQRNHAESSGINQPKLSVLQLTDFAALASSERFRQEEDGGKGRSEIVRNLNGEVHSLGTGRRCGWFNVRSEARACSIAGFQERNKVGGATLSLLGRPAANDFGAQPVQALKAK